MMENKTGLSDLHLTYIKGVLAAFPMVRRAVLFGSRAKGTARPNSDIDIAIYGDLKLLTAEEVSSTLDGLPTLYTFDVIDGESIKSPALIEHIERVGIVLLDR
ncbi:hypothetical protein FACS18948_2460 [Clostridia bacterium]|nr:hypothetical protein FACS18948_2460 [Clostridia bacterium]